MQHLFLIYSNKEGLGRAINVSSIEYIVEHLSSDLENYIDEPGLEIYTRGNTDETFAYFVPEWTLKQFADWVSNSNQNGNCRATSCALIPPD